MKKFNSNLYPSGGYFFKDEDGVVHRAKSWEKVALKLEDYRRRQKKNPGSPLVEVMAQACSRNPSLCYEDSGRPAPPKPPTSLKQRIILWLNSMLNAHRKVKLEMVTPAEADQRAQICASCPFNTPMGVKSCSTCRQAVKVLRQELIGSRKRDGRLEGCSLLGADLTAAVHLDEPRVPRGDLPAHCWRKISV
jgi:hypothetical protein